MTRIARDYTAYTARDRDARDRRPAHRGARAADLSSTSCSPGALRSLAERAHDPGPRPRRLPAALARRRRLGAELPRLREVRRAGSAPGVQRAAGGAVCSVCRPPGSSAPAPETFALLAALLTGDWGVADACDDRHRREGNGLVSAFLQWHIERGLRRCASSRRA